MKKIYIIKAALVAFSAVFISSCDYLDYDENKNWKDSEVWSEYSYISRYLTSVYSKMPGTFNCIDGAFLDSSTDNSEHRSQRSNITKFNIGAWNMFDNPNGAWSSNYNGIRLANTFIEHADTCTLYREQFVIDTKRKHLASLYRFRGEARFLKAFYYFELFKRYGAIPIVEDWTDEYTPSDYSRKSVKEVAELIGRLCDDALPFLPGLTDLSDADYKNNLGRPFKGAAYALKSRTYLYAASKLSNQDGSLDCFYDSCAVNSAKLFKMGYSLSSDYSSLFQPNSTTMQNNKEVILDKRAASSFDLESSNFPIGYYSGKGNTNPTQDLVDAYENRDGSTFDWNNPEHVANMYNSEYRDARFSATIIYNGFVMKGRAVECFEGGLDASNKVVDGTRTGYYLKKYLKLDTDLSNSNTTSRHYWPLFRYSEILLNYAEAMNALYGPDADPKGYGKTALQAINEVRNRAKLKSLSAGMSKEDFFKKLQNERRVELAFEGHRHWDVRRWMIAPQTIGQPIHGVKIIRNSQEDGTYSYSYTPFKVEDRTFENKMYLYPIPSGEILMSDKLKQNPGW